MMKRRTFLRGVFGAALLPVAIELCPLLRRPVAVVEEAYDWNDAATWQKANPALRVISNGCRLAWVDWVDGSDTMHHNILVGDGSIELADCVTIVCAGGEGDGACGTIKVYDGDNRYKAGAVITPNNGGTYFSNIPGHTP